MNVGHVVTGYDKGTERLIVEHAIPATMFAEIRRLADVADTDSDVLGSYPLSLTAVRSIASKIAAPLNVDAYDWFLEPIASD